MGGLYRLFLKITPIMLLICCICFGISHTFQKEGQLDITYLTTETINIGTEEEPENKTIYVFDMPTYVKNIDQHILSRSIEHTVDLQAYQNLQKRFNQIWEDGYQFGDIFNTILNAVLLGINTLILPINIILVPLRVASAIILTGMSLVGINTDHGIFIVPILNFIVDNLAIPYIGITNEGSAPTTYSNTYWYFNKSLALTELSDTYFYFFSFTNQSISYYGMTIIDNKVYYIDVYNGQYRYNVVYQNNNWINDDYRTIHIVEQTISDNVAIKLNSFIPNNATLINQS